MPACDSVSFLHSLEAPITVTFARNTNSFLLPHFTQTSTDSYAIEIAEAQQQIASREVCRLPVSPAALLLMSKRSDAHKEPPGGKTNNRSQEDLQHQAFR